MMAIIKKRNPTDNLPPLPASPPKTLDDLTKISIDNYAQLKTKYDELLAKHLKYVKNCHEEDKYYAERYESLERAYLSLESKSKKRAQELIEYIDRCIGLSKTILAYDIAAEKLEKKIKKLKKENEKLNHDNKVLFDVHVRHMDEDEPSYSPSSPTPETSKPSKYKKRKTTDNNNDDCPALFKEGEEVWLRYCPGCKAIVESTSFDAHLKQCPHECNFSDDCSCQPYKEQPKEA